MFDYETTLSSIEEKLRQLGTESGPSGAVVESRCKALEQTINKQNIIINQLREENKLLTTGNKPAPTGNTAEIQNRINQLIRTIDQTLALMGQPIEGQPDLADTATRS
ncbi:MAG: hypothetical protein K5650_04735 [Bacteroidales bacterium]|nr:hypothetical protein [Bacteroidales bacterium]